MDQKKKNSCYENISIMFFPAVHVQIKVKLKYGPYITCIVHGRWLVVGLKEYVKNERNDE